jgi:Zn ribbon nucleic-acid-binding protein
MSEYIGTVSCPQCGNPDVRLQNWTTYVSVVCTNCGHKFGELAAERRGADPNQRLYVPPDKRIA